jgi:hypothetical protein
MKKNGGDKISWYYPFKPFLAKDIRIECGYSYVMYGIKVLYRFKNSRLQHLISRHKYCTIGRNERCRSHMAYALLIGMKKSTLINTYPQ